MKNSILRRVLPPCVLCLLVLVFEPCPVFSQEKTTILSTPPLTRNTPSRLSVKVSPIEIKPGEEIPDWVARWELARVLSYVKRYEESIREYRKVLEDKPGLTEATIEMANVLFWKGDHDAALQLLGQLPQEDITGPTLLLLADLLTAKKEYAKAEPLYRSHLAGHPEDHSVRLKLADMLSWQKKYDASLAEYQKILKTRPEDIQVRRRYAFVLIWAGKHAEAAAELKKTLD